MAYIDDDEFLISREKTMREYVIKVFQQHQHAPAINFFVVMMGACEADDLAEHAKQHIHSHSNSNSSHPAQMDGLLPRISRKQLARRGDIAEGKLIMRTDAVLMFRTHTITQFTDPGKWSNDNLYFAPFSDALYLHYKSSFMESRDIFGRKIPCASRLKCDGLWQSDLRNRSYNSS